MNEIKTIDKLLLEVTTHLSIPKIEISVKDKRILMSLSKQLSQGNFLTERQAFLLVKIFNENLNFIKTVDPLTEIILKNNVWSKDFRTIEKIRKICLDEKNDNRISIQFTYDKRLKTKISEISKKIDGSITTVGPREYQIHLSEKNVYTLVKEFQRDHFDIDEKILKFYHEIDGILKTHKNYYDVFNLSDEKFKKIVEGGVGKIDEKNLVMLHDKKIKYGYQIFKKIPEKTLTASIAQREQPKIFINSSETPLDDVMQSLKTLNRFPMLVIFDGHDSKVDKQVLENLKNSIKNTGIDPRVGIYFRYDKDVDLAGFNSVIAESEFNQKLDDTTSIVGISNNKIPKFMIKTPWKPESVISFTNNFRSNKSSVRFSDVDLIIYYGTKQPMHGNVNAVM